MEFLRAFLRGFSRAFLRLFYGTAQTGITSNGAVSLTEDDDAGASSRQSGGGGAAVDFSFSLEDELAAPSRRRNAAAAAAASRCSAVSDGSSFDVVFEHSRRTGQSERSCPEMDDEGPHSTLLN